MRTHRPQSGLDGIREQRTASRHELSGRASTRRTSTRRTRSARSRSPAAPIANSPATSPGTARRWVLSYDAEPLILDLYRSRSDVYLYRVTHYHTMIGTRQKPAPGREIIFSNLPVDPAAGSERGHLSFRDASEAGPKRPVVRAVTNDNCTAPSASTPRRSARSTWVSPATAS